MKKIVLSLCLLLVFATSSFAAAPVTTSYWKTGQYACGDAGVGLKPGVAASSVTNNTLTKNITGDVLCTSTSVLCVFALQNYTSAATGSVLPGQMYALSNTTGTKAFTFIATATVGAYWNDITGTTCRNLKFQK